MIQTDIAAAACSVQCLEAPQSPRHQNLTPQATTLSRRRLLRCTKRQVTQVPQVRIREAFSVVEVFCLLRHPSPLNRHPVARVETVNDHPNLPVVRDPPIIHLLRTNRHQQKHRRRRREHHPLRLEGQTVEVVGVVAATAAAAAAATISSAKSQSG